MRIKQFLLQCDANLFQSKPYESREDHIARVDSCFHSWVTEWNESLGEPTILATSFLKYTESYRCCVSGVKNGNSWLMEVECSKWLAAYKLTGKTNYVNEGSSGEVGVLIGTLYGGYLSPDDLELRRQN